jgi:hypothetical protein
MFLIVWDMGLDVQFCTIVSLRTKFSHPNQSFFLSLLWCRDSGKHPTTHSGNTWLEDHQNISHRQNCDIILLEKNCVNSSEFFILWFKKFKFSENLWPKIYFIFLSFLWQFFDKKFSLTYTLFWLVFITSNTMLFIFTSPPLNECNIKHKLCTVRDNFNASNSWSDKISHF